VGRTVTRALVVFKGHRGKPRHQNKEFFFLWGGGGHTKNKGKGRISERAHQNKGEDTVRGSWVVVPLNARRPASNDKKGERTARSGRGREGEN